jgi:uncharacterized protein (TIGR02246 family)
VEGSIVFSGDLEAAREIEALDRGWVEAFNRGDIKTLIDLYAEDVVAIPPDHPDLHGRDAIAGWLRTSFRTHRFHQELINDEVHAGPDWAVMRGRLTLTMTPRHGGESVTVHGKHMVVWRRDDHGAWKAWRDIWSVGS